MILNVILNFLSADDSFQTFLWTKHTNEMQICYFKAFILNLNIIYIKRIDFKY